jgi:hypothetical protein
MVEFGHQTVNQFMRVCKSTQEAMRLHWMALKVEKYAHPPNSCKYALSRVGYLRRIVRFAMLAPVETDRKKPARGFKNGFLN